MSLLVTEDLTVTFGGLRANDSLDLAVDGGTIVGLIGPNGAGKTTCIDALTGFVASSGRVRLDDVEISSLPPHRRSHLGLGRTWQSLELFDDLSVRDNLRVAAHRQSITGFLADLVAPQRLGASGAVEFALEVLGIGQLADRMPQEISQGQRKLVSAGRALAGRPRVVCMDEPAAGLDSSESRVLGEKLRDIVGAGITILLVDHDMGLVLDVCDYVYVIDFGRKIAEGTPSQIQRNEAVIEAYLGTSQESA